MLLCPRINCRRAHSGQLVELHATVQSVVLVFAFLLTQSSWAWFRPPLPTPQDCQTKSILLVRFPYGVGMMSSQPSAPVQYTGQPTGPGGQVRPLFPSAQPGTPSPGPPASRATFPAYSSESEPEKKPQLIASTGSSSKIIHPPEDISLVSTDWSAQTPPLEVRVEALGVLIKRAGVSNFLSDLGWISLGSTAES